MSNYIEKNTVCEVTFTNIEHKVSEKGNEYAVIETTNKEGAISRRNIFPYKFWDKNKDKDGNLKDEATQLKEFGEQIVHVFGNSLPNEGAVKKLVDVSTSFKELISGLNTICSNNGIFFRMKFGESKPSGERGYVNAEFKMYSFGVTERLSVKPSKLYFKSKEGITNKPVSTPAAVAAPEDFSELPF